MHTGSNRLTFVNLPVESAVASREFFTRLGFSFDDRFCDDQTACLVLWEMAYVMLLERTRFADFTAKQLGDRRTTTSALIAVSAADREAVDTFADTALAAGATPAKEPLDYGSMYGRSSLDLDGHRPLGVRAVEQVRPAVAQDGRRPGGRGHLPTRQGGVGAVGVTGGGRSSTTGRPRAAGARRTGGRPPTTRAAG